MNGARCINNGQDYNCICASGYTGQNCERQIDFCATTPCQNGATCEVSEVCCFYTSIGTSEHSLLMKLDQRSVPITTYTLVKIRSLFHYIHMIKIMHID